MALFTTVLLYCRCGQTVYFQTESGSHDQYAHTDVPLEIADELDGRSKHCPRCKRHITLRKKPAAAVPMEVCYDPEVQEQEAQATPG